MADGRGSRTPGSRGAGHDAGWAGETDPADEWVLDPVTGEYRMRLPEERRPAVAADSASGEPDYLDSIYRPDDRQNSGHRDSAHRGAELLPARRESAPAPRSRAASRGGSRAADRRAGRGRRRNSGPGGGLWLAWTLGVVGLLGCGTGGYLLLHDGSGGGSAVCAAAKPAPKPAASTPSHADAGPALKPGPKAQPIDVRVTVLDGSGQFGQAESVLTWMQNQQLYTRTSNGGPVKATPITSLVYEPAHADQARTLAAAMHLPAYALHGTGKGDGLRDPMVLTLGKDFQAPGKPLAPPTAPAPAHSAPAPCGS